MTVWTDVVGCIPTVVGTVDTGPLVVVAASSGKPDTVGC